MEKCQPLWPRAAALIDSRLLCAHTLVFMMHVHRYDFKDE